MPTPDVLIDPFENADPKGPCHFERITEDYDVANPKQRMELLLAWHIRLRLAVVRLERFSKGHLESQNPEFEKYISLVARVEESIFTQYVEEFQAT